METRFIPDLDLGEQEFEEDIQTHHSSYAGGCSTVNAVGDPHLKEKNTRRKRMRRIRGMLSAEKRRKAFKMGYVS